MRQCAWQARLCTAVGRRGCRGVHVCLLLVHGPVEAVGVLRHRRARVFHKVTVE